MEFERVLFRSFFFFFYIYFIFVVVREEDDGAITVAFMDPAAVLGLVDQSGIEQLAGEVRGKLEKVRDQL